VVVLSAFTIVLGLTSARAWAGAKVDLLVNGNPGASAQLKAADPNALSRVLDAVSSNATLVQGSSVAAAVDVSAGTLRVYSTGSGSVAPSGGVPIPQLPRGTAALDDMITVSGPGTKVAVKVTMIVDGALHVTGTSTNGSVQLYAISNLNLGNGAPITGTAERDVAITSPAPQTDTTVLIPSSIGTVTGSDGVAFMLEQQVMVVIGQATPLVASIVIAGTGTPGYTATADFGSTAHLQLSLPAGYTYTSASGLLLTQAGAPGLPLPPDGGMGTGGMDMGPSDMATGDAGGTPADMSGALNGGRPGPSSQSGCSMNRAPATVPWMSLGVLIAWVAWRSARRRAG